MFIQASRYKVFEQPLDQTVTQLIIIISSPQYHIDWFNHSDIRYVIKVPIVDSENNSNPNKTFILPIKKKTESSNILLNKQTIGNEISLNIIHFLSSLP